MYEERTYRQYCSSDDLVSFRAVYGETDLFISCERDLKAVAEAKIKELRLQLNKYIVGNPVFESSFVPIRRDLFAPQIAKEMMKASSAMKVGPMAAVAGAFADFVGKELLKQSGQVIIENGGDIFMKISIPRKVAVFAGDSPFSEKILLEIDPEETPLGICTSSGTVGPSISFGSADAVVVKAATAALADAAATAIGNEIKTSGDIEKTLEKYEKNKKLHGILIIKGDKMGIAGAVKIARVCS
ncbi:MAG: UPF0280 family protein [Candidatus Margulisiibacteriota bacterium]